MKHKILISCANGEVSYELIKYLKKKYYVIGIDTNKYGLAKKICDKFYISPKGDDKKFPKFINKLSKNIDAVFLFADEEIMNISKHIDKLKYLQNKILISDFKSISLCNDKKILENKLKFSFNFPRNNKLNNAIIKPRVGRGSKNILFSKDKKIINIFNKNKNFLVQDFIEGKEFTIDCFFKKNGELLQSLTRQRVIKKNVSIVGKSIYDKKIDETVKNISKKIKFKGPINFQFIKKKNTYFLIEINPRISGSIYFSIKSNFDPFQFQISHLKNKELKTKKLIFNKYFYRYYHTYS